MKALIKNTLILAFLFTFTTTYAQETNTEIKKDTFVFVENPPKFPGGDEARLKYISSKLKYPKEAKDKNIEGTVYITFVVEADGSITNVRNLRGVCESIDKVALDVVRDMPKWIPATTKGKAVRSQFNMPLRFILVNTAPKGLTRKEKRDLKKKQKAEAKAKESNE